MTMIAHILDERSEGTSKCYLAKLNLDAYIAALPNTYKAYDIQREIVSNIYLDHLVNTVLEMRHIPPIVLVVDAGNFSIQGLNLKIESFKILDGLQRTYRLQSIRKTIDYALKIGQTEARTYLEWSKFKFSKRFSEDLRQIDSHTDVLRIILEELASNGPDHILASYTNNQQWFEIWTGLQPREEVQKMLTLNAGHKPVKIRHQLELLFMNLLPILRAEAGVEFELVREKEIGATQFSKDRKCGTFHFAHLITALLSLYTGKPVTPNAELVQGMQSDGNIDEYAEFMTPEFLKTFVDAVGKIDQALTASFGEIGTRWMGREVSLAGLFAGVGAVALRQNESREKILMTLRDVVTQHPKLLDLEQFEVERNSVELSKVNIGSVNRNAVFKASEILIENNGMNSIDWKSLFNAGAE